MSRPVMEASFLKELRNKSVSYRKLRFLAIHRVLGCVNYMHALSSLVSIPSIKHAFESFQAQDKDLLAAANETFNSSSTLSCGRRPEEGRQNIELSQNLPLLISHRCPFTLYRVREVSVPASPHCRYQVLRSKVLGLACRKYLPFLPSPDKLLARLIQRPKIQLF
jgi:hypothetical protein